MVLVLTTASGCGYSQQEIYPDHVQTVAIPLFENRTFYQGVEFDLTEALVKEIELRTPYKVISNENARAEAELLYKFPQRRSLAKLHRWLQFNKHLASVHR